MSRTRHSAGRRRKKHDEHTNHEAWAIPYADLLTLLLAFFVVMYAISSVNAGKYRVLSDSLFAAFRGAPRTMQPIQVGDKQVGTGADMNATAIQQDMLDGKAQSRLAPLPVAIGMPRSGGGNTTITGKLPAQAAAAAVALSKLADQIEQAMNQMVKRDMVTIRRNDFWIEVEMKTDILFPSGSARLGDDAISVIEELGGVLGPFPNPIRVEGYTDNKPINTAVFYSNWELSAARAGSVVRVLANHGVSPDRLAVIGFGEQRPAKSNDTVEGRNANRRVVIVILSTELTRQVPAQASDATPAAPPTPGGAISDGASPADSPQAAPSSIPALIPPPINPAPIIPAPIPQPAAQPVGAAQTAQNIQHNTGTEPAP